MRKIVIVHVGILSIKLFSMKYKQQIATGALAVSLLVSGSSVFAATPQDLGIKNTQSVHYKPSKNKGNFELRKRRNSVVGVVSALTNTGFTVNIKNLRTKISSSVDVKTNNSTKYKKDGINTVVSDLAVGQKVIVSGDLDKTANTITPRTVKIATKDFHFDKVRKINTKTAS